jgi:hypothetical protein
VNALLIVSDIKACKHALLSMAQKSNSSYTAPCSDLEQRLMVSLRYDFNGPNTATSSGYVMPDVCAGSV